MKKVIAIAFIAATFAACNNKAEKKEPVKDSTTTVTPVDSVKTEAPADSTNTMAPADSTKKPM